MTNIKHIAVIPDGNRRWARSKGLPTFEGHRTAAEKILPELIEKASKLNIPFFTFWALSTENLKDRSKKEVENLLNLMRFFLKRRLNEFIKKDIKLDIIGNISELPEDLQRDIEQAVKKTKNNKKITFILAINYGGKDEIIRAIKKIVNFNPPMTGQILNLDKKTFAKFLDTKNIPDPDLIIRTGGEQRLSGFMLWQSEYSEFYFSEKYFPDFNSKELEKAVKDYSFRQRRFGK